MQTVDNANTETSEQQTECFRRVESEYPGLMSSMSVHYIRQKTLNTTNALRVFFMNCNTLLHVSTLLGHLQGEVSAVVTLWLYFIVELLWSRD
jgi:hypothetical protein